MKKNNKTKYVFVTGGVVSSLGKGIIAASLATILQENSNKVFIQKFDPYLNVDPGTMSPYEHGEVYITTDGAETDLDLGHYERFLDIELNKHSNVTSGRIYYNLINDEREGKLYGKTAQVIPHITDAIKKEIDAAAINSKGEKVDVVITEIGGTVGDIESLPFMEAIRQFKMSNPDDVIFIHTTLVPYLPSAKELKSKPTQQSIKTLNSLGIFPDFIMLRTSHPIPKNMKEKISLQSSIPIDRIFVSEDSDNIYKMPNYFNNQKFGHAVSKLLKLKMETNKLTKWDKIEKSILETRKSNKEYKVAVIGKYTELIDSYISVIESLKLSSYENKVKLKIDLVKSDSITKDNVSKRLSNYDGIIIPGGFGQRGIEGKFLTIQYARENNISFLGLCLGMQLATIEYAINVLKLEDANSTEFKSDCKNPIFNIIEDKKNVKLGGTLRLGAYDAKLEKNSLIRKIYGKDVIQERHRHRYEFNNNYLNSYGDNFKFSGINPQIGLVEFIEITNHSFFIGTQAHPEFTSKVGKINPLFNHFVLSLIK